MMRAIGLLLVAGAGLGVAASGRDLVNLVVRFTQVTVEKYTMHSIGKTVMVEQITLGRRLTPAELAPLLRRQIKAGGRDPAQDLWRTPYFLETRYFHSKVFQPTSDEFVVCSAGPDRRWADDDDLHWMNFVDPAPRRDKSVAHGTRAIEEIARRFETWQKKASSALSIRR